MADWMITFSILDGVCVVASCVIVSHSIFHMTRGQQESTKSVRVSNIGTNILLLASSFGALINHVNITYIYPKYKHDIYDYVEAVYATGAILYTLSLFGIMLLFIYRLYATFANSAYQYSKCLYIFIISSICIAISLFITGCVLLVEERDNSSIIEIETVFGVISLGFMLFVFIDIFIVSLFVNALLRLTATDMELEQRNRNANRHATRKFLAALSKKAAQAAHVNIHHMHLKIPRPKSNSKSNFNSNYKSSHKDKQKEKQKQTQKQTELEMEIGMQSVPSVASTTPTTPPNLSINNSSANIINNPNNTSGNINIIAVSDTIDDIDYNYNYGNANDDEKEKFDDEKKPDLPARVPSIADHVNIRQKSFITLLSRFCLLAVISQFGSLLVCIGFLIVVLNNYGIIDRNYSSNHFDKRAISNANIMWTMIEIDTLINICCLSFQFNFSLKYYNKICYYCHSKIENITLNIATQKAIKRIKS